jgi:hypothetical protein
VGAKRFWTTPTYLPTWLSLFTIRSRSAFFLLLISTQIHLKATSPRQSRVTQTPHPKPTHPPTRLCTLYPA